MKEFIKTIFASALGFFLAQLTIVFFLFAVIGAIMSSSKQSNLTETLADSGKPQVLFLHLFGEIPEHKESVPDSFRPFIYREIGYSLTDYIEAIDSAKTDEEISGIYLKLDPLATGWATLTALRESLASFKESGKFIYTYAESFSEPTYYLASVSDRIYQYSQGSFELNGMAAIPFYFKNLLEKLDVQPIIFKVGSYKSAVEPFIRESMSPEARQQTTELLNDIWNHYSEKVAESRTLESTQLNEWATELKITNAKQAFEAKLIDLLKSESEVFDDIKAEIKWKKDKKLNFKRVGNYLDKDTPHFSFSKKKLKLDGDNIAVIQVSGEITGGYSTETTVGSKTLIRQLRKAKEDEAIKAVVLRVNSPGGSALASDVVWKEASAIDASKPVVVSMGDMAASGGYYIAASGRFIFAEPTTITGSIGVFGVLVNLKGLLNNKLGLTTDRVTTHTYSDIGQSSRPIMDYERNIIQSEIESTYKRFLSIVSSSRKIAIEKADELGQGRVWSGVAAHKLGLVDSLGGLPKAIAKAAELAGVSDYNVHYFTPREEPWEWLFSNINGQLRSLFLSDEEWRILQSFKLLKDKRKIQALDFQWLHTSIR